MEGKVLHPQFTVNNYARSKLKMLPLLHKANTATSKSNRVHLYIVQSCHAYDVKDNHFQVSPGSGFPRVSSIIPAPHFTINKLL